jgi:BRCT domain type II-containing protein
MQARTILNPSTRDTTPPTVVEMGNLIGTEAISQRAMVATSTTTCTTEDSRETTPMAKKDHHNGGNGHRRFNSDVKKDLSNVTCFKWNKTGHYSTSCPENKTDDAAKPIPFQKG